MSTRSPFRHFKTSPGIIRLAVMMHVRLPLSLRNVECLLLARGIDVSHETIRFRWNRFGPMSAAEIQRRRVDWMRAISTRRRNLWRAVDHKGEALEAVVTERRDKLAALKLLKKLMKRHGPRRRS